MMIPEIGKYYANDYNDGIYQIQAVTPPPMGRRDPEDGFECYYLQDGQMSECGFGWDETFSLIPATKEHIAQHREAWSKLTFEIRHYDKIENRWVYATELIDGRKKERRTFSSRQKARVFLRNYDYGEKAEIIWCYDNPNPQYCQRDDNFPNRARWDYE